MRVRGGARERRLRQRPWATDPAFAAWTIGVHSGNPGEENEYGDGIQSGRTRRHLADGTASLHEATSREGRQDRRRRKGLGKAYEEIDARAFHFRSRPASSTSIPTYAASDLDSHLQPRAGTAFHRR